MLNQMKQLFRAKDGTDNPNLAASDRQKQIGLAILSAAVLGSIVLLSLSKQPKTTIAPAPAKKSRMAGVVTPEFVEKAARSDLSALRDENKALRAAIGSIQKALGKQEKKQNKTLKQLNGLLAEKSAPSSRAPKPSRSGAAWPGRAPLVAAKTPILIESQVFSYATAPHPRAKAPAAKTAQTYVPPGTFASVVLLEGADANASVNGQSDTLPILARVLDRGTLPNGRHSHLKGCFLLASIYGDISSERGEARLQTLSCTRADGSIFERQVQGHMSFSGKEGIRGTPVMRNGKILEMAGISGILSSFGSAIQSATATQSLSALGATTTVSSSKILENGLGGGANTAMGRLANYYIKRADQYHPIIEIGSGTVATVVFQKGFSITDSEGISEPIESAGRRMDAAAKQSTQKFMNKALKLWKN